MSKYNNAKVSSGIDWLSVWIYAALVALGIICIFMVEYKPDTNVLQNFLAGKTNYSKQLMFTGISVVLALFILLADSKLFTAFANLFYAFGVVLMLSTFVIGKAINGSKSWIPLGGGFNLQPVELCKIFTALALAKYLSRQETNFNNTKSQIIAIGLALFPLLVSTMQHELGLGLVYTSFFIVMYREGLPPTLMIIGASIGVLLIASIIIEPNTLAISLTVLAALFIYILRRQMKRNRFLLRWIVAIWVFCVGFQRFAVPFIFNNVFQCYQSTRIFNAFGGDYDCSQNKHVAKEGSKPKRKPDDYNVRQSKIAIGSGGLLGRGFLKGTQTRGRYVPEQHTDFIFTSLGEAFGFVGCVIFLGIYLFFLFRIIRMAERQRSTFSRVYAYCVASILFFHIALNILMTIGLFPSPGITLPMISYGGSSLVTFTILIFILIRLDADRQMVLR
jgi:rod shape determining protein RodA